MAGLRTTLRVENNIGNDGLTLKDAKAIQQVINDGTGWLMQGCFGRELMRRLEAGDVMLGQIARCDFWGNRIPARDQVQPGTKGSYELVVETHGKAYADALAAVPAVELRGGN